MLFSVILPTYNRASLISDAINCVLNQNHTDLEIIIVDDGSTDNTREIISSYSDNRIKYIYKENGGVSSARNIGIKCSSGKYISFIDSDDLWKVNKLKDDQSLLSINPEANVIFTDLEKHYKNTIIKSFHEHTKYFSSFKKKIDSDEIVKIVSTEIYQMILKEVFIKTPALTVNIAVFHKYGLFSEALKSGEDWELLLRILEYEDAWFINKSNSIIRISSDSLHLMYKEQDHLDMIIMLQNIRNRPNIDRGRYAAANDGITEMYLHLYWLYSKQNQFIKCIKTLINAYFDTKNAGFILRLIKYVLNFKHKVQLN